MGTGTRPTAARSSLGRPCVKCTRSGWSDACSSQGGTVTSAGKRASCLSQSLLCFWQEAVAAADGDAWRARLPYW